MTDVIDHQKPLPVIGEIAYYSPRNGFIIPVKIVEIEPWSDVWIDVPVGWAISWMGQWDNSVWPTIDLAMAHCIPVKKMTSKRRNQKVASALINRMNWIASTGNDNILSYKWDNRPVYIRTGRVKHE